MAKLTRLEVLDQVRLPKAERVRLLGQTPLEPGEASVMVRIRAPRKIIDALLKLTPGERGEVVRLGLEARASSVGTKGDSQHGT
jgi:hypothetical protein